MIQEAQLVRFFVRLTARQREVVQLASDGLTNSQIAARLFIQPSVVAEHLSNIYAEMANLEPLAHMQPNRYLLIRVFAGFFERNPHLLTDYESR